MYKEKHSSNGMCFHHWHNILEIQPWMGDSRFASVIIPNQEHSRNIPSAHPTSPSRVFVVNPSFNCGFAVNAVFRIMRVNSDHTAEFFTGWVASPPVLTEDERYMFFGVCTAHTFDKAEEAAFYKGCFRQLGNPWKDFHNRGFFIEKEPLFCLEDDGADIAIFRFFIEAGERNQMIPHSISFLLPCSPSQYGAPGTFLATFGYNSFTWFLQQVKMELEDGQHSELSLWELYGDMFRSHAHLYHEINNMLDGLKEVSLCCSPLEVMDLHGDYGKLQSSTMEGCRGGPVMSNDVEGVVCYVHSGRDPSSKGSNLRNRATGLDNPGFVECYAKHILKLIPGKMEGRETLPFRRWCALHGLPCPVVED